MDCQRIVITIHGTEVSMRERSRGEAGTLFADLSCHALARNGVSMKIPRRVLMVIIAVASRGGRVVSPAEIAEALWGDDAEGGPEYTNNIITGAIAHARMIAPSLGFHIETEWGRGWRAA